MKKIIISFDSNEDIVNFIDMYDPNNEYTLASVSLPTDFAGSTNLKIGEDLIGLGYNIANAIVLDGTSILCAISKATEIVNRYKYMDYAAIELATRATIISCFAANNDMDVMLTSDIKLSDISKISALLNSEFEDTVESIEIKHHDIISDDDLVKKCEEVNIELSDKDLDYINYHISRNTSIAPDDYDFDEFFVGFLYKYIKEIKNTFNNIKL